MTLISPLMMLAVFVVMFLSCVSDVRSLRIPNGHSLVILGCFVPAWLVFPEAFGSLGLHVAAAALMFVVTYGMFAMGMMGGGDSKLGSALALWGGLNGLVPFMFYMAVTGGILGLISIFIKKKKPFKNPEAGSWFAQLQEGKNAVPYGVAISFGAVAAFFHTGLIHNQLNEVFKIIT
jgi:prepilin peptidase CpaA